jgi:hypothetical protein
MCSSLNSRHRVFTLFINCNRVSSMHQSEKSVFITSYMWSNETRIDTEMNMAFSFETLISFLCSLKRCVLLYESHHWHNQIRKVLDELSIEVCKAYETLYTLYWFRACQFMIVFIFWGFICTPFSLSEWTLDTWLTWLQTHICQCQFVGRLLKVIVVSFIHDFGVDAAIHQWKWEYCSHRLNRTYSESSARLS